MNKFYILFVYIIYVFFSCNSESKPEFFISDMNNLQGNWTLKEVGVNNKKNSVFKVDSTNSNFKKLSIDIDKMNFHLTTYPFENFEPAFPISIDHDTIFLLSGTTIDNKLVMLKKNTILFKFSSDHGFLKLFNLEEKSFMIFSKE